MNSVFRRLGGVPLILIFTLVLAEEGSAALDLHKSQQSPYDLKVSGQLQGVPAGEARFIWWADLRQLPSTRLKLTGEFVPGEQEVTIVWLAEVWKNLPSLDEADTILAECADGYASVYTRSFVEEFRPFVVLEINGQGPEKWPPEGLSFNPGPYVISVSSAVKPSVETLLDAGHKRPWGVNALEIIRYQDRFRVFHSGKWATLSHAAEAGRELWVNSCFSCHRAPGGELGGWKSDRPFEVLAAHATYNQDFFKRYVRNPQATVPGAKMEAHPHYTEAQLESLIAFITAAPKDAADSAGVSGASKQAGY